MTRLYSIEAEIAKLLQEHADVIQKKDLTTVQITLRLYPKGGLVRKSHFHTESERDCMVTKGWGEPLKPGDRLFLNERELKEVIP